jgi:hypothetical protein
MKVALSIRPGIRLRAVLCLVILVGALAAAIFDDVFVHTAATIPGPDAQPRGGDEPSVSRQYTSSNNSECTICFFHKVLGDSLLSPPAIALPLLYPQHRVAESCSFRSFIVPRGGLIRGPPQQPESVLAG